MMLEDEDKDIILIPETTAMPENLKRCPAERTWNVTVDAIVEVQMYPSEPNTGKLENPHECWDDCED